MKAPRIHSESEQIVLRDESVSVTIYPTTNRIYRSNPQTGIRELKSSHSQFTLIYYEGRNRVKRKFSDLAKAKAEANLVLIKLVNGESEALKLTGLDRSIYVASMQKLKAWKPDADLNLTVAEFVEASSRLPKNVTLRECVDFYIKRQPSNLPKKTVRAVTDEFIQVKIRAGQSAIYVKDLKSRLHQFADAFQMELAAITGRQIEDYLRALGVRGRTQNNHRRIIGSLLRFARNRDYLSKDHNEIENVKKADNDTRDTEIFTPAELRQLLEAARPEIVPYLAITAFAGIRAKEMERLDWMHVNLDGRFIEIKPSTAKTRSRRLAPITDNLHAWLAPYAQRCGQVVAFENISKQLTEILAPKAGVIWKHNALRHSFVSYRLASTKNPGQVALEAGNSEQMIFRHYWRLVTEPEAVEWFSIMPEVYQHNIVPLSPRALA